VVAVVDPQRDVELYIEDARKNGLRIGHVIETHLHADVVSGHHELAARGGFVPRQSRLRFAGRKPGRPNRRNSRGSGAAGAGARRRTTGANAV
jgi:glyoxylase-like metal-dependent hydrolase (beta-lactamase superfamily II)